MEDTAKAAQWRRVMAEQEASGMSMAAFCRERGIRPAQFYNWRAMLKRRDARRSELPGFVRVVTPQFMPEPAPDVRLHVDDVGTFELAPGFDSATFARALAVVRKVAE